LLEIIKYVRERETAYDDGLYIIYLFYDEYDGRAQMYNVDYVNHVILPVEF